jgi:uncharacterized Tic20 family protein
VAYYLGMGGRLSYILLGVLLVLVGCLWVGQGLGYIRGSFMTGQTLWLVIGALTTLAGLVLVVLGARRRSA